MRIEAVTVSKNYSDFLQETAKFNAPLLDRWVIVTTPDDKETLEVCRRFNLDCVQTDEFDREDEGKFNKGRGIARGMNFLSTDCWAIHMDGDIVLPPMFRKMLEYAHLEKDKIYGCDRINVRSWEDWQKFLAAGHLHAQHGYHMVCNFPKGYETGTRVIHGKNGFVPLGFFQLAWHAHGMHWNWRHAEYPDSNSTCAHSDIKKSLYYDRRSRVLIPEFYVVHLESEPAHFGTNWKGRKTKRFGPPGGEKGSSVAY